MNRSKGLRYGTTYHLHLYSEEVEELRRNHRQAYCFWLHLQARTYTGVDQWPQSMGSMSREMGCNASTLRRWAVVLEGLGLVRRESLSLSKESQVWSLLVPPSCRSEQKPAANRAAAQFRAVRRAELEETLSVNLQLLDQYFGLDAKEEAKQAFCGTGSTWEEARASCLAEVAALELKLAALT